MEKKFILYVEYGTGRAGMVVNTPDLQEALQIFLSEYGKVIPDTKMYGLPNVKRAEIFPLIYSSEK